MALPGERGQEEVTFQRGGAASRAELRDDPHRPQYHFTPPRNWMNDPNGLIQWNGCYHLFYQHHPFGPLWGSMHWGHAVSDDLVHWSDLPIALSPSHGMCDEDGVFSGCAVDDGGTSTIVYTGVRRPDQLVCLATSDDDLTRWVKEPANPVLPDYPPALELLRSDDGAIHFRDPSVWREGGHWKMIVGSGIRGVGGAVLLYGSPDLRRWTYEGPLLVGNEGSREPIWTGSMWECPQLFPLGDRHVLLISVWHDRQLHYPAYLVGTYSEGRFWPQHAAILDPGSHYAPQTLFDDQGRRLIIGWLREQRSREAQATSRWNGAMSIPWLLSLGPDHLLRFEPAPELGALRRSHWRLNDKPLNAGEDLLPQGMGGDCLELSCEFDLGTASVVGMVVRRTPDGKEETRIVYERDRGCVFVDRTRASLDTRMDQTRHETALTLGPVEPLRLRVFLDRSVVELVANERALLSERIYPTRADASMVGVFAVGGRAGVRRLDVWEMGSPWE